ALRLNKDCNDPLVWHLILLEKVFARRLDFDIVHFHIDYLHFPLSRRYGTCQLSTLHGRLDLPDLVPLYREYPEMPVCSISSSQRRPLPYLNWQATVYHGLPKNLYSPVDRPGEYLAFLGRISPEKGLERAIELAGRAGLRLRIAAKVDKVDREYFQKSI